MTSGPYGDAGYPPEYPPTSGIPGGQGGYPSPPPPGQPYAGQPYAAQPYPSQPYPGQPYLGPTYPGPPAGPPPSGYAYPGGYGFAQPRNGMGTAGLVLGIIGVVLCWTLWVGWIINILAIIFGGVGMSRANHGVATNKSSAAAGLVLGVIGLAAGLVIWFAIPAMVVGFLG